MHREYRGHEMCALNTRVDVVNKRTHRTLWRISGSKKAEELSILNIYEQIPGGLE